jgi:hypothetical protein
MSRFVMQSESGILVWCSTFEAWYTPHDLRVDGDYAWCSCTLCDVERQPLQPGGVPQPHCYPYPHPHRAVPA